MVKRESRNTRTSGTTRGEPDAVRVARPVRRADRGNPPVERLAGRPGPTPHQAQGPGPGASSTTFSSCIDIYRRYCPGWMEGGGSEALRGAGQAGRRPKLSARQLAEVEAVI